MSAFPSRVISECEVTLSRGRGKKTLPMGARVDRVEKRWVPETADFGDYSEWFYVVVFSAYGLCLISKENLRDT